MLTQDFQSDARERAMNVPGVPFVCTQNVKPHDDESDNDWKFDALTEELDCYWYDLNAYD